MDRASQLGADAMFDAAASEPKAVAVTAFRDDAHAPVLVDSAQRSGAPTKFEPPRAFASEDVEGIRVEAAANALRIRSDAQAEAERLNAEARAEAARMLAEATVDVERLRQDAKRAVGVANARAKEIAERADADVRSAREVAASAAAVAREQAASEGETLVSEARALAASVLGDAQAAVDRQDAEPRTSAAIREEVLGEAQTDAARIREAADLDGLRIVEEARTQASFEAAQIREQAATQGRALALRVPPTTTPIHSSEITLREFPHALRGFDPEAVSKWLSLVEQSYALVEDELERQRRDLNDLMAALGDMGRHLVNAGGHADMERIDDEIARARGSWNRALRTATSSAPPTRLGFDTLLVRTALMETPLRRCIMGYSQDQVRRLLETSAAQLARLENQLHLTNAENERLRLLFLEQITEPSPEAARGEIDERRADVGPPRISGPPSADG